MQSNNLQGCVTWRRLRTTKSDLQNNKIKPMSDAFLNDTNVSQIKGQTHSPVVKILPFNDSGDVMNFALSAWLTTLLAFFTLEGSFVDDLSSEFRWLPCCRNWLESPTIRKFVDLHIAALEPAARFSFSSVSEMINSVLSSILSAKSFESYTNSKKQTIMTIAYIDRNALNHYTDINTDEKTFRPRKQLTSSSTTCFYSILF